MHKLIVFTFAAQLTPSILCAGCGRDATLLESPGREDVDSSHTLHFHAVRTTLRQLSTRVENVWISDLGNTRNGELNVRRTVG